LGTGIYVDARGAAHDIQIYNNLVYNNPNGQGIAVGDEGGAGSLTDINIYNNVIYNCDNAFMLFQSGTETFENIYFINNTCYNNQNTTWDAEMWVTCAPASMTNCIIRNNIIYSTKLNVAPIWEPNDCHDGGKLLIDHNLFYNSGGAWYTDADTTFGDDYIEANPLLVSPTTDLSLSYLSPARESGSPTNAPTDDYDGVDRPQDVLFDIGAYEFPVVPESPAPSLTSPISTMTPVVVLVYLTFCILLVLFLVEKQQSGIKILIVIGVLIYVGLSLLPAINSIATSLLGG
jgi:hypothetical protein